MIIFSKVEFDEKDPELIVAMKAVVGEKIPFEKSVKCAGGVEVWLNVLLAQVKQTVSGIIAAQAQCLTDPDYDFLKGFTSFPGQVCAIFIALKKV